MGKILRPQGDNDVRASPPALANTGRLILELRDTLVRQWAQWIGNRAPASPSVSRPTLERELGLVVTSFAHMVGPRRHEALPVFNHLAEHYGQMAAMRGLAAGEVVEELHYLRELLTLELAPRLWRERPRQGLAVTLRLNRILDRAVALAVVGYTDMLVATLFANNGVPSSRSDTDAAETERQLDEFEHDLGLLLEPR